MTRNGIEYDLYKSPYILQIDQTEFIFSSKTYMNKFKQEYMENRKKTTDNLTTKYGFEISHNLLSDLTLYIKIEKRGFLIKYKGEYICQKEIMIDGESLIKKKLQEV